MPEGIGELSMSTAEIKADTLNQETGKLKYTDCPICKNKGYVAEARGESVVCVECRCMAKRRSMALIEKSGLKDMVNTYTFSRYTADEDWQKRIKAKAAQYIQDGEGKWFVIVGTPGSGKTHICTAICTKLILAGKETRYMLWRTEAPRLKALVNDREAYEHEMKKLSTVPVLYIDDFLKGSVSDADINLAFELLNNRYNARKLMTIISSEKSIEQICDIDEAVGSRIYERARDYALTTPKVNMRLRRQGE